jgi:hypothetical protein
MRKTEEFDKEVTEYDWKGALIWALHELQEHD